MQILKTNNGSYLFDPLNDELVLKRNGKFSSVFIGYQLPEKNKVVIKILNPALAEDPSSIIRFHKEALKSFEQPNLQKTLDAFNDESGYYLIKEYIDGFTLTNLYKHEKIEDTEFYIRCAINLLKILEELHSKDIIHCDVRPQNVIVMKDHETGDVNFENPQVILLDLGLAKTPETENYKTTQPFSLIYSPPEQIFNMSKYINHSSDTYAVGICLYECLTSTIPFINENPEMVQHLQLNTPLMHHKKIPQALYDILAKATHKATFPKPPSHYDDDTIASFMADGQSKRYKSATAMKHALMDFLDILENEKLQPPKKKLFGRLFGR